MTASHTPGPWEIRSCHETRGSVNGVTRSVRLPNRAEIIVSFLVDPTPAQDEEARANARLVAAAPDLLAALTRMVALFDSGAWSHANVADARAAIQRATVPQS